MKNILIAVILMVALAGAGYFVVKQESGAVMSEIQDMKQRLGKAEEFIKAEEEARKVTQLQPDADLSKIIKTVNVFSARLVSLENSFNKSVAATEESIKKQKTSSEDALKKQTEALEKLQKEMKASLQEIMFDAAMANIRGNIAKARADLLSKNIATAKDELEVIDGIFEKLKNTAAAEKKKAIEELQASVKKARSEMDGNLPAAVNRIDLIWHEIGKLLRKS